MPMAGRRAPLILNLFARAFANRRMRVFSFSACRDSIQNRIRAHAGNLFGGSFMDKEMPHLGVLVDVTAPGGFVRRGYVSSVDTVIIHKKSGVSAERVSVFYVDTMKPKHETFLFEGEYWINFASYKVKKHTCLPVYKIRVVPCVGLAPYVEQEEVVPKVGEVDFEL